MGKVLQMSFFDLLKKIPAIKRKEAELDQKDEEIGWALRRFEDLDEHHKEVVRSNGFASAFVYDHDRKGSPYARQ